ncbi:MAG: N-acetylmuramoyl-L-alanine amidase [Pseudohongiellaceae bacterium]|nr:N-acetylmuramoyl-L-alanine amidase [Pseudohongiellaceae bacterium]
MKKRAAKVQISQYIQRLPNVALRCLCLLSVLAAPGVAMAAEIEEIRLWRAPDYTRVVFDLDSSVQYSVFALENPHRIVIDMSDSKMVSSTSGLDFKGSPVKAIRSAARNGSDVRVVLDLSTEVNPSSFTLAANGDLKDRLVIDLYDIGREQDIQPTIQVPPPATVSDRRDIIVAIDAGHGGEDPGALSYNRRIQEKDVALAISRAIFDRLNTIPGYHPVMVRDGDYSVKLQNRPRIAREKRADIFLSIHADSFRTSRAEGVTIYALSEKIADDENARRVAQKENSANLLGGAAGDTSLRDVEDDLARTLLDLSMAWSIEQSINAASYILDSLGDVARLRKDKAQQGNLWVLRSPDIPSLLIETGYLSNPREAERLNTPSYQRRLADGIVKGVMSYFYEAPPQSTLVAWQKANGERPDFSVFSGGTYRVKRGDSLSLIAQRSGVSTQELKNLNGLRSDVIRVGQELSLPGSGEAARPAIEHTTRRGETLSGIAQRYRVSLSGLRRENNLRGDSIQVGQVLKIPAQ